MKISKLTLAIATVLGAGATSGAFAMDLYVDTKTKQIYAEPGRGRELMGSFEKVQDTPAKAADKTEKLDKAEIKAIREDLALKTNEIKALSEHAEEASHVKTELGEKGLEIKTADGNFKMAVGGRLQFDAQTSGDQGSKQGSQLNAGAGVRRGRIHTEGTLYKDFDFKFEYDFVRGNGTTAAGITDAWVEYTALKPFSVTAGQFKEPFSLESVTSNRFLTFNERSYANNAFVEWANPYLLGLSVQSYGERWTARAALQAEPIGGGGYNANTSLNNQGNANRTGASGNTSYGAAGRVTGLPYFKSKTELVHLGASGAYRQVNNTTGGASNAFGASNDPTSMRFASQIADVDRTPWADTGNLTNTLNGGHTLDNYYRLGAEAAGVAGPFSVQTEVMATQLNGKNYGAADTLWGGYATVSWFITGESRNYDAKKGAFGRQKPNKNFSLKNGGWGAWEIATRFDELDMNTKNVHGGRIEQGTVGLNWYINPHVRMMADYSHIFANSNDATAANNSAGGSLSTTNGQHPNIYMLRTQLDW
ncbi:MAG: porin [Methylobacter tundripaludum]|nr:porin [Methylobacter tundripaludum]